MAVFASDLYQTDTRFEARLHNCIIMGMLYIPMMIFCK